MEKQCELCGKMIKPRGMGTHNRMAHGIFVVERNVRWGFKDKDIPNVLARGGRVNSNPESTKNKVRVNLESTTENTKVDLEPKSTSISPLTKEKLEADSNSELTEKEDSELLKRAKKYLQ